MNPRLRVGLDDGLIAVGMVLITTGWIGGLAAATVDHGEMSCRLYSGGPATQCNVWFLSLLPIVGAPLGTGLGDRERWGWFVLGVAAGAFQFVGFSILLAALLGSTADVNESSPLSVSASVADDGAYLAGRLVF